TFSFTGYVSDCAPLRRAPRARTGWPPRSRRSHRLKTKRGAGKMGSHTYFTIFGSSKNGETGVRPHLDTFCNGQTNHHAGAEKPADFQPGVIGRYGGKRKMVGINSQLPL